MSTRHLVMPRGINIGTRNRVPMSGLRETLVAAGYSDVVTVLQSGNVILTSTAANPNKVGVFVEQLLADEFNVKVRCIVRSCEQVQAVLDLNPLGHIATDPSRYLVNFLSEAPDQTAAEALLAQDFSPEALQIHGTEAYVWSPAGVKAMTLSYAHLERQLEVGATARNWNTLQKIANKF
ncbi:MAG: DUF1697 domain-containing protein [Acidimicrobiales bacterium]